ncbi:MAG: CPBP family intramembrane metalloprotease [Clostridia bacterium]|nr:CPBP family intramembrane metalloprotease [Clostridia bacterium]
MNTDLRWNRKQFLHYLIWTYAAGGILQIIASIFSNSGNTLVFTILLTLTMYTPFLGVVMAKIPLRGMGWKPKFRGNLRYIAAAMWLPAAFHILGAVLYFGLFPDRLDFTGKYLESIAGAEGMAEMTAQGLTVPMVLGMLFVTSMTYAPLINMFFALGEEVGWRGAMQPMLNDRFGRRVGRIFGGVIWGAWHWPVMLLAGYEYGKEYFGAPLLGMAAFCLFTIAAGTLIDALYEKSHCIWLPALAHGAVNGFALETMILDPAYTDQMIFGPHPIGLISMIPALLVAGYIIWKKGNN